MDLSKISIKLRPRNGYAAIDLGTRMAQRNLKLMLISFIIVSLPLYLVLLFIFPERPLLITFFIWWLKPLWERPLLLILSRDVFHQATHLKEVLKFSLTNNYKQWFQSITWRRFSPTRSFDAPVVQLENLSGKVRRERLSALHSRSPTAISGITFVLHLVEALMTFGVMLFILQFIPNDIEWILFLEQVFTNTGLDLFYLILSLCWYLAMVLVAPFYVAGGFSSYLNQRSIREAWDLELVFRQLANKHTKKKFDYKNLVAALLVCIFTFSVPQGISSEQPANNETTKVDAYAKEKAISRQAIQQIQSGPEYKRVEQTWEFRKINPDKPKEEDGEKKNKSNSNFDKGLAKTLSWIFIILLVIFLLYKLPAIIEYFDSGAKAKNKNLKDINKPEQLFGLDLKQENMPDDIVQEAQALWQAKQHREALGLLYRASLSKLIHDFDCEFEDGFTELECQTIVTRMQLPLKDYFAELTSIWRLLAYGHQLPTSAIFLQISSQWPEHFEPKSDPNAEDDSSIKNTQQAASQMETNNE